MKPWKCDKCGMPWEVLRGKCLCGGNIMPPKEDTDGKNK